MIHGRLRLAGVTPSNKHRGKKRTTWINEGIYPYSSTFLSTETYYVDKRGNLSLQSTIYQAYGAGTPDVEGIVDVLYNGFVRVTGIERVIPYYSLYYVPHSHYYIELNNNTYSLSEYVSDDTTVE